MLLLVKTSLTLSKATQILILYKQDEIIQMIDCLIDRIFVLFAARAFQQMIGVPMGTNCTPLLADSFKDFSRIKIKY
jgi:hypothetical protein